MRAIQVDTLGPPSMCEYREVPVPVPGQGEVLIKATAAGVNFPDVLVVAGQYQNRPPIPFTPGKEVAGTVVAIGPGVTSLAVGNPVMAFVEYGAFAEQVIAQEAHCTPLPNNIPLETAAAMGLVYQTAYFALTERANMKAGETVLVTGASGGVGVATIQVAKALGGKVIAGVSRPDKAEAAIAAGADHTIDLMRSDLRESVREQVYMLTNGHGVDILVDPVGGHTFDASLRALAWRGRAVVVGFAGGSFSDVRTNYLLIKNISVIGLDWSHYRERLPEQVRAANEQLLTWLSDGRISPHISERLPLSKAALALTQILDRQVIGKIILTMGQTQ